MLIRRPFWKKLIEEAWQEKNIVWLMGVRRIGKTSLCQSFDGIEYFDCELPRVRQLFDDPQGSGKENCTYRWATSSRKNLAGEGCSFSIQK